MNSFVLILGVFLFGFISSLSAQETTGWFSKGVTARLYVDGIFIFETQKGDKVDLPRGLTNAQEIDAYLFLAEYFLKTKNKQGIGTILLELRKKGQEYRLADALITTLWKRAFNEEQSSQKTLDNYIKLETNLYLKNLGKNIYSTLFQEGEDEKKSPEKVICTPGLAYYNLCRIFRLQYYSDRVTGKAAEIHRNYINIIRVLAPFYEESNLHSVPFLEELDEDLPVRLAYLGFATEAINFQRIILESERAAMGTYNENSLERLSFFQVLAGQMGDAQNSLSELLRISKNKKTSFRNRIFMKLGSLAYLQGRYSDSLQYYLELDFNDWSTLIHHPIQNEPLSIPEAKDLVGLTVWKAKGSELALKSLRSIPDSGKIYLEEVWPKLRIAQIISDQNADLSTKVTDEISYLAQSRGWKRLEYSSTLLQGYNHILTQQFRKSTIEFTKSRGILTSEESGYGSDWLRYSGLTLAHIASGQKAPVETFLNESLKTFRIETPQEELLSLKHYKPDSFSKSRFFQSVLNYLSENNDPKRVLEVLVTQGREGKEQSLGPDIGLHQILQVRSRFRNYSGFQTQREANFSDSIYSSAREVQADYSLGKREDWNDKFESQIKTSFLAVFSYGGEYYWVGYSVTEPKQNQWQFLRTGTHPSRSSESKEFLSQFLRINASSGIQIYMNSLGLEIYREIQKENPDLGLSLFSRFVGGDFGSKKMEPVFYIWDTETYKRMKTIDRNFFDGTKILPKGNRVLVWDYPLVSSSYKSFADGEWKSSGSELLSAKRILRRLDYRTVPQFMVLSGRALGSEKDQERLLDWASFWLGSGVEAIYFQKKISRDNVFEQWKDLPRQHSARSIPDTFILTRDMH